MKLTELQVDRIDEALVKSQSVLAQVKQRTLKGEDLKEMKLLEAAVTNLEVFRLIVFLW